jgi:hypothetical protein
MKPAIITLDSELFSSVADLRTEAERRMLMLQVPRNKADPALQTSQTQEPGYLSSRKSVGDDHHDQ